MTKLPSPGHLSEGVVRDATLGENVFYFSAGRKHTGPHQRTREIAIVSFRMGY